MCMFTRPGKLYDSSFPIKVLTFFWCPLGLTICSSPIKPPGVRLRRCFHCVTSSHWSEGIERCSPPAAAKGVDGCWWMLMAPQKENHINLAGFNGFNPAEIKISSRWGLSQRWTVTGHPSIVGLCYPIDISTINIHGLVINSINQFAALYGDPCLKMCMNHGGC